jgi:hypothetical protein
MSQNEPTGDGKPVKEEWSSGILVPGIEAFHI